MKKVAEYFQSFSVDRVFPFAALAIVGLASWLRLIGLDRGIWLDEYYTITHIHQGGITSVARAAMADNQLPAFYILLEFWSFFGDDESFLRLFPVICSVSTVALLILWVKRYSHLGGLLAGLLFAVTPSMLRYSQELRTYSLLLLATVLSLYFISRIKDYPKETWGYIGLTLSLTLAATAHLVGSMIILAMFGYALLTIGDPRKTNLSGFISAFSLPGLTFSTLYLVMHQRLDQNTNDWWMPAPSWELLGDIARYYAGTPIVTRFITSFQTNAPIVAIIIPLCLAIMSLAFVILGQWQQSYKFLVGAVLFWLPLLGFSLLVQPVFYYRTILPGLIPMFAFIAIHLSSIQKLKIRLVVIVGLVALNMVFIADWVTNIAHKPLEEWSKAAQILKSNWQTGDMVVYYPNYIKGPVEYYWPTPDAQNKFEIKNIGDVYLFQAAVREKPVDQPAGHQSNIYIVIRWGDAYVDIEGITYQLLLSVIESDTPTYFMIHIIFVPYDDLLGKSGRQASAIEALSDPLAQLESFFGPPLTTRNINSLVWSTYDLGSLR